MRDFFFFFFLVRFWFAALRCKQLQIKYKFRFPVGQSGNVKMFTWSESILVEFRSFSRQPSCIYTIEIALLDNVDFLKCIIYLFH